MQQPKNTPAPPFTCQYSPNVPELLTQLGCSLVITTYQAGKLLFLSPTADEKLVQLPRSFLKPMGVAISEDRRKMALATRDEIIVFADSPDLATYYPKAPNRYDALYMPRMTYHTNALDIHDLSFGENERLFAVNTLFSCLISLDSDYNFTPYWTPPFISKLSSDDRCHLNGMAMENGLPRYVTAFNQGDSPQSWRENLTTSGILMDVRNNELLADDLAMPHSPRIYDGKVYVLLSATGELVRIDPTSGHREFVYDFRSFIRGLAKFGDYLFVGLSKLRKNSSTFAKLEIAGHSSQAGVAILHLPTGSLVGQVNYLSSVDEIYDLHVLPNALRPNILNKETDIYKMGVSIPTTTYWGRLSE